MEEYKSNSHKSRENSTEPAPEKKVEKVISGTAKSKKKTGIQKFMNFFIPEDVASVKSYIFEDVVVPAVKDIILDTVKIVLGTSGSSTNKSSTPLRRPYSKCYDERERRDRGVARPRTTGYDYDDVILENRGDAEAVLDEMDKRISTYGIVTVADFYELTGMESNYTDNKYGWSDIRNASVDRVREGYLIRLPRALPLN